jgi:hypothetical protein
MQPPVFALNSPSISVPHLLACGVWLTLGGSTFEAVVRYTTVIISRTPCVLRSVLTFILGGSAVRSFLVRISRSVWIENVYRVLSVVHFILIIVCHLKISFRSDLCITPMHF